MASNKSVGATLCFLSCSNLFRPLQVSLDRRLRQHPCDPPGRRERPGDVLMPMLHALGQHGALLSLQDFLLLDEHFFANLDDMHVVCLPDRIGPIFEHLQEALEQYARIQVHLGKTQVWNGGGHVPLACVEMQAAADRANPQSQARIWRGAGFVCWASRLATRSMCRVNSRPPQRNTAFSSSDSSGPGHSECVVAPPFLREHTCHVFRSRDSTCRN